MSAEIAELPKQNMAPYQAAIQSSKVRFDAVGSLVNFEKEQIFAIQALMKTDYAMQVANNNPGSVKLAMANVASIGLTLNPANAYAYLVPRDGAIVLDISYKGLIKVATDAGSILWAKADLVYSNDSFEYFGPAKMPVHRADVFSKERGDLVGSYCIAKTRDGDILTEILTMEDIEKIRSKSDLYRKKQSGPWVEWLGPMVKKANIKRASKTWPYTDRSEKVFEAIELASDSEGGYTFENEETTKPKFEGNDDRKARCAEAVEQYESSLSLIREKIAQYAENKEKDDLYTVAETWASIPQSAQCDLWLAPTKGGWFTTYERDVIKTQLPRD